MSNKTFIPAFQCSVGDWKYYICMMKYGEVARQVQFAYELGSNAELGQLIQRGLSSRALDITQYLMHEKHRFLGAIVIAAWGGEPEYTKLSMDDPDGMLRGIDQGFGVLTFDGTQAYFALDGQHRLRAIKDAMRQRPELGTEDICVLIVTHYDTKDGRVRTRRLFTNINKNAKQTNAAENLALDEDNGYAILTRRMLEDHEFLKSDGRVRVILGVGDDGELRLAGGSVPKSDPRALTTITVLCDVLTFLGWDLAGAMGKESVRPSDEVLEDSAKVLTARLDDLLRHCGDIRVRLEGAANAREIRVPKNAEGNGHPFMRPVVQKAVAKAVADIRQQDRLTWVELMARLSEFDWRICSAPWQAVAICGTDGKVNMIAGKENTDLLAELLRVHLAPGSRAEIKRARKSFKELRGVEYPISEDALASRLVELPPALAGEVEPPGEAVPEAGETAGLETAPAGDSEDHG